MLSDADIQQIHSLLVEYHSQYLQRYGVKLPSLRNKKGNYTKDALVLVYLAQGYPQTKPVSKTELTGFARRFYPDTADVQQARHLGMQKGWYVVSGTRHNSDLKPGDYQLVTLEEPYPAFRSQRREGIPHVYFKELKRQYGFRCATCGSKEGKPAHAYPGVRTKLMAAHMDPRTPLQAGTSFLSAKCITERIATTGFSIIEVV